MFVKVTTSGPRQYVKLVEAFRDEAGVSRQRVIATLGRLESVQAGAVDSVVNGLLHVAGKPTLEQGTGEMAFAPARSVGDTWLLTALWKQLGFDDAFRRVLRMRLKAADHRLSPERALEMARRIQFHQVTLQRQQRASGLTSITPEQRQLFAAIDLPEPSAKRL